MHFDFWIARYWLIITVSEERMYVSLLSYKMCITNRTYSLSMCWEEFIFPIISNLFSCSLFYSRMTVIDFWCAGFSKPTKSNPMTHWPGIKCFCCCYSSGVSPFEVINHFSFEYVGNRIILCNNIEMSWIH